MNNTGYIYIYLYIHVHINKNHIGSGGKQSMPWRKWNIEVHLFHAHFDEENIYWNFVPRTVERRASFFRSVSDEALSGLGESEQDSANGAYASFGGPLERILTRWWLPYFLPSNHLREFCGGVEISMMNPLATMLQTCLYNSDLMRPSRSQWALLNVLLTWIYMQNHPRILRVMLPAIPCPRSMVALYELADIRTVDEGLMRLGGQSGLQQISWSNKHVLVSLKHK